jgi:anaerobic magnesium-protoporphyrin IX monomethyl ester cyclase
MLNYELSRGCPFNCTYCVNGVLKQKYRGLGSYHRVKPVERSIAELKLLVGRYGFDFIRFWDESFTALRTDYLERYAKAYLEQIGLPFLIYARAESVSEDKVRILKDMGCRTFAMGIESGNPRIRREVMNRHMSDQTIIRAFHLVAKYGIRTSAYNIIGLPREDRAAIFDTIELNRAAQPSSFSVTLLEPYKGTPIRQLCEEDGLDPAYEVSDMSRVHFAPRGMAEAELKGLFRAFPLYVKMSRERWPEIARAEKDDQVYQGLMAEYSRLK